MKKILIIGAGNMGSSIANALLSSSFVSPEKFSIADPSQKKTQKFLKKGCNTAKKPEQFLLESEIIILATKPQVLRDLLKKWNEKKLFSKNQIIISIAAGISVSEIQKYSGLQKIVRVMPNTPLLVGKGVSGYYISPEISKEESSEISHMIKTFGLAIYCESEEKINSITALSGSGPAYFFQILESMSEQAEKFGFSREESEQISLQTLLGAGFLAENSLKNNSENFSELRKKVTSKGGTTEAALQYFKRNNFSEIFQKGIQEAKKRAEEL